MTDNAKTKETELVAGAATFEELVEAVRAIGPVEEGGATRAPDELIACIGAFRESPTHRNSERIACAHGIRAQAVGIIRLELRPKS
jgi:hypothetical protein